MLVLLFKFLVLLILVVTMIVSFAFSLFCIYVAITSYLDKEKRILSQSIVCGALSFGLCYFIYDNFDAPNNGKILSVEKQNSELFRDYSYMKYHSKYKEQINLVTNTENGNTYPFETSSDASRFVNCKNIDIFIVEYDYGIYWLGYDFKKNKTKKARISCY